MTGSLLGVVVVNYGSHLLLEKHLTSFDAAAVPARIVVVDNFTADTELAALTDLAQVHEWHVAAAPLNVGFGEACNLGAEVAMGLGCDVIMLLNPDASLNASDAAVLARRSRLQPRAVLSPVIRRPDGAVWSSGSRVDARTGAVGPARTGFRSGPDSWLTGACLVLNRQMWNELGGFEGDYFLYWEDVDLSRRCVTAGGELVLVDGVTAVHDVGATQGEGKSPVYLYYNCRNRLLFATRHLDTPQLIRWIVHTPAESLAIMRRNGLRVVLKSPRLLMAGVRGTLVGLGLAVRELARRSASPGQRARAAKATV